MIFKRQHHVKEGITSVQSSENFLFLNVEDGKEEIYEIHKRLYTGILEPYFPKWLRTDMYHPHITLGRVESEEDYKVAIGEIKDISEIFETIVNKVSVEIIAENQDSIIEMKIELNHEEGN